MFLPCPTTFCKKNLLIYIIHFLLSLETAAESKKETFDDSNGGQLYPLTSAKFRTAVNGNRLLVFDGHCFHRNSSLRANVYWRCAHARRLRCRARIVTNATDLLVKQCAHTHEPVHRLQYGQGVNSVRRLNKNRHLKPFKTEMEK